jgi:hypothetical protein
VRPPLASPDLARVFGLACAAEDHFAAPQDVEWTLRRDELFALQSRPITTLAPGAAEADGRSYKDLMFFPTSLDAAVARIRAWFAACPVVWAPGAAARGAVPTKYEAIERKRSHTDLCAHCTAAMRRFVALRAVAVAVAAVAAVYVVGGLGAGRPLARGVAALAAAFAASLCTPQPARGPVISSG